MMNTMNIDRPSENLNLPFVKRKYTNDFAPAELHRQRCLPVMSHVPTSVKNHIIAVAGEFIGTFMFLFLALSATQVANSALDVGSPQAILYIALAFGFSLAVNAWVFFRITGGLFNPAVTLGLCLIGALRWTRGGLVVVAQLFGAMASAGVVSALFPGVMTVRTTLSTGTSIARGVFIEMFLTAELVFTIFMLAVEKHKGTFIAPIGIGLALFAAELSGVAFTGGSLNPARSFGPDVVLRHFDGYHWIYWVGPALGSLIAVAFYKFVKALEYESALPGQDMNDKEAEQFRNDEDNDARGGPTRSFDGSASGTSHYPAMSETSTGEIELPKLVHDRV